MHRRDFLGGISGMLSAGGLLTRLTSSVPTTLFVSPAGDDANPGTYRRPLRTLAVACRRISPGRHTIRLAPGEYPEVESCVVPPGVSVVGAGQGKTVLLWSAVVDMEEDSGIIEPPRFLIRVEDSRGASLSGFAIEGRIKTDDRLRDRAHGGIFAHRVTDFEIRDVAARSFNFGAIYLSEAVRSRVHHCRVEDSGHPHKKGCTGGIVIGDLADCAVHDNVIRESRGAYGIKGVRLSWGWPRTATPVWARPGDNRIRLVRAKFYNNDIKVRQQGGWGEGQPNMVVELWNARPEECEIYGNTFNECVSLVGEHDAAKTVRIHHNRFVLEPGYSYAIEVSTQNVEIDHNYFRNGYYPIACFGPRRDGLNIHHNIFDGIEKIQLMHFRSGVKDFRFVSNTVYVAASFPMLSLGGTSENVRIANNLFCKEGERNEQELVALHTDKNTGVVASVREATLSILDNAFCNWKPEGERALVLSDPGFTRFGNREDGTYFRLKPGSPLRARGIGATASGDEVGTGTAKDSTSSTRRR